MATATSRSPCGPPARAGKTVKTPDPQVLTIARVPLTLVSGGQSRSLADSAVAQARGTDLSVFGRFEQIPKLTVRVRFSSPAPRSMPRLVRAASVARGLRLVDRNIREHVVRLGSWLERARPFAVPVLVLSLV